MDALLTEKYRPINVDDVIGNKETISALKNLMAQETIPHLLFTGPPGTGKTTISKIIAKKISEDPKNILELNASDDRGIETVRTTIKNFSTRKVTGFKIIVLDECDSMTSAAQQAMRRTMELCSADCRFILICNNIQKITEPIQSRCAVYLFDRIVNEELKKKLEEICKTENIKIESEAIDTIIFLADSDMRQAINILQSTLYLNEINEDSILKITGQPSPKRIEKLIILALKKKFKEAYRLFDEIWADGYDTKDLMSSFFKIAKNMENYELLSVISKYKLRIFKSIGSRLQFYSLIYDISAIE